MDIDVTARVIVTGFVNGQALRGSAQADFNTGRGGRARCEFSRLPTGFNPASLGTHL
jgi:hypothetical protein